MTSKVEKECFLTMSGKGSSGQIPHLESWSNPDAETYLTGIDYYERPRDCRERLDELYPMLCLPIPESNAPIPRMRLNDDGTLFNKPGSHHVRWGAGTTNFEHGESIFKTEEDVFSFSPLATDFSTWEFLKEKGDYSSEEVIYNRYRKQFPAEWGDRAPEFSLAQAKFYNTMIMWPILTFGWEMFLSTCLYDEFERIMDEFAEINRRVFKAFSRLPVNFCKSHDDITMTNGPICSREWMNKHIFPRYEEFWGYMINNGIKVIFNCDGNLDAYVDDVISCGARGIITEPYTDFKSIAKKYPDIMLAGEGDCRILTYGTKEDIEKMVISMAETGKMCGGYFMKIGNQIPWNVPGENIKYYLDYSHKYAHR